MENKLVDGRGRGKAEAIAATSEREGGMSGGGGMGGKERAVPRFHPEGTLEAGETEEEFVQGTCLWSACVHAQLFQSCLSLCDAMGCSPPGFSVHGILQARRVMWVCHALLQGIFLTQGLNPCLLYPLALAVAFFTTSAPWETLVYGEMGSEDPKV